MKGVLSLVAAIFASGLGAAAAESFKTPTVLRGSCKDDSHIAEGLQSEDLTKRQSRFFCDSVVITNPNDDPRRVLVTFAQAQSSTAPQIGFAGTFNGRDIVDGQRVYLRSGTATPVDEGACKFFRKEGRITSLFCGAKIDTGNRRTVPLAAFEVDGAVAPKSDAADLPAYRETGVARCSCPGTDVEFSLDGEGGARLTSVKSNYVGFTNAAKVKKWSATLADKDGQSLLVLDNGRKSRIMTDPKSGKVMGFLADGGVSDMLCQVLVRPK